MLIHWYWHWQGLLSSFSIEKIYALARLIISNDAFHFHSAFCCTMRLISFMFLPRLYLSITAVNFTFRRAFEFEAYISLWLLFSIFKSFRHLWDIAFSARWLHDIWFFDFWYFQTISLYFSPFVSHSFKALLSHRFSRIKRVSASLTKTFLCFKSRNIFLFFLFSKFHARFTSALLALVSRHMALLGIFLTAAYCIQFLDISVANFLMSVDMFMSRKAPLRKRFRFAFAAFADMVITPAAYAVDMLLSKDEAHAYYYYFDGA